MIGHERFCPIWTVVDDLHSGDAGLVNSTVSVVCIFCLWRTRKNTLISRDPNVPLVWYVAHTYFDHLYIESVGIWRKYSLWTDWILYQFLCCCCCFYEIEMILNVFECVDGWVFNGTMDKQNEYNLYIYFIFIYLSSTHIPMTSPFIIIPVIWKNTRKLLPNSPKTTTINIIIIIRIIATRANLRSHKRHLQQ